MSTSRRSYVFLCLRCDMTWVWDFEVREARDRAGNQWRLFFRDGLVRASPERGVSCPYCSGLRVRLLPSRVEPSGRDVRNPRVPEHPRA